MIFEFQETKTIETYNFILRELKIEDYKDIYEIYSDEETLKYQCPLPIKSLEEAKEYTEKIRAKEREDKAFIRWAVTRKEGEKVLGVCSLHVEEAKIEVGYMLNKKYWRQNIMTEVLSKVITVVSKDLNINTIEAKIHPENIASIKLCEKLGFKKIDIKKDCIINKKTNKCEDRVVYCLELG